MNMPSNATMGGIGMAATAGGSVLSAFGSIASGFANRDMNRYQASVARLNQQIAKQNAEFASQTGKYQNLEYGLKAGERMGQIKTAQAASGFDVNSGSAKQVRASQQNLDQLSMATIRSNAAKTAYNYETQASIAGSQASAYDAAGSNAATAGFINAGSSILGGVSSVSSEWLQGQRTGLWGA